MKAGSYVCNEAGLELLFFPPYTQFHYVGHTWVTLVFYQNSWLLVKSKLVQGNEFHFGGFVLIFCTDLFN